ncbi:beta-ketoacyl synthase [Anopheles sinensis]|uniref:Beta-ketoacyl synthase n=1 Tax=Anopheles sinensis TaxID=74873 RepID=A0A084WH29_ANOSI|nr:beta-ketoacyl synthase [Anopheles sinensis]
MCDLFYFLRKLDGVPNHAPSPDGFTDEAPGASILALVSPQSTRRLHQTFVSPPSTRRLHRNGSSRYTISSRYRGIGSRTAERNGEHRKEGKGVPIAKGAASCKVAESLSSSSHRTRPPPPCDAEGLNQVKGCEL